MVEIFYARRRHKFSKRLLNTLIERANENRENPTRSEAILWDVIRCQINPFMPKGWYFGRQIIKYPYIIDFYCKGASLGIELDGSSHWGREKLDAMRHKELKDRDVNLIHLNSDAVFDSVHLDAFIQMVLGLCEAKLKSYKIL